MFLKWFDHCSSNYFLREILTMTMWRSTGFWSVDLAPPISRLTSALRFLGPCRQPCQEPALSTSRSTLDDRTRVLQPPMIEAGSAHQWTIPSPGTPRTLNQLPLNPGLPVSRCHLHVRQGLAINLTGSQPLLSDQPLSLPNSTPRTHVAPSATSREHTALEARGEGSAEVHRMLPQQITSPRSGDVIHLPNTQK